MKLFDILAFAAIVVWPVIPLFWIPVHGLPRIFKRFGLFSYVFPAVVWTPVALLLIINRDVMLSSKVALPLLLSVAGTALFVLGAALQIWTARLLTLQGIMGMPEVSAEIPGRFVTSGAFAYVRHPTYLSHTMMFAGLFLMSGMFAMALVTVLDLLLVLLVIIPLEDRELSARFGPAYDEYRRRVPAFFPSGAHRRLMR